MVICFYDINNKEYIHLFLHTNLYLYLTSMNFKQSIIKP